MKKVVLTKKELFDAVEKVMKIKSFVLRFRLLKMLEDNVTCNEDVGPYRFITKDGDITIR